MCRWIAYSGKPIFLDTLITRPTHSLVKQSLESRMHYKQDGTRLATNGDGFGMGWYGSEKPDPGLFKVPDPAWNNENITEICPHIKANIFMAHIRAASNGAIQRSNAHPFKYKNWLFQHNGHITGFEHIRRELQFDIASELYPSLRGTTDSETFFLLALTYGLEKSPKEAMEKMIVRVERACREKGIGVRFTLSCAMSDGKYLYTIRYASGSISNSQYYATHPECIRDLGDNHSRMPGHSVIVVSEPLDQGYENWTEMQDNSFATIINGSVEIEKIGV